jgi:hypothetical protein
MSDDQDRIGAFVDDEMTPEEAEAFARAMAADPALARQVDIQTRLRGRLRGAYGARLETPAPEAVMRLLGEPRPVVVSLRPWMRVGVPAGVGFALAASIAIAVGLSNGAGGGDVAVSRAGALVARGGLADALDHRLGTDVDPKVRVQLVESFRASDGRYCRIFRTRTAAPSSGLACKESAGWTIAALATPARREASDFRQAGSDLPRAVVAAMGDLDLSQPLSAQEELAARAGGWSARPPAR